MTFDEQTVHHLEEELRRAEEKIADLEEENEQLREHLMQATADLEGHQARPSALYARLGGKRQ